MSNDVRMTGTYQMLLLKDGRSLVEERAWKLARDAGSPDWRLFADAAKEQLRAEVGSESVTVSRPLA